MCRDLSVHEYEKFEDCRLYHMLKLVSFFNMYIYHIRDCV